MADDLLDFFSPPQAFFMSGSKSQTDVGGSKIFVSIDKNHNFHNEGVLFNEMSFAIFDEDVEDQIEFIYPQEYDSVREDPEALIKRITSTIYNIINKERLYYGILDFEVDAFMNMNPMSLLKSKTDSEDNLKIDYDFLNSLNETHKENRDKELFPESFKDVEGVDIVKIGFEGKGKENLRYPGPSLEDYGEKLRLSKGYAIGLVCASKNAVSLYIISENIVFDEESIQEHRIDEENLKQIEKDFTRKKFFFGKKVLFPISWFRIDVGLRSFETLDLWNEIKDDPDLQKAFNYYDRYISGLIYKKFKPEIMKDMNLTRDAFLNLSPRQRTRVMRDLIGALRELTRLINE